MNSMGPMNFFRTTDTTDTTDTTIWKPGLKQSSGSIILTQHEMINLHLLKTPEN